MLDDSLSDDDSSESVSVNSEDNQGCTNSKEETKTNGTN